MDMYKQKWTTLEGRIFSLLCLRAGERLSQREIALLLKVSPTAVANSVSKLLTGGMVLLEKTKTVNFISFNRDDRRAVERKRVENMGNIYASGLSDYLLSQLAGGSIILFGSYAKGEDSRGSDIDIAVVGRNRKSLDLTLYEKALNRSLNVNFYDSWGRIERHLRNNILNGIVLHGGVEL
jgi:predicted nucleotidyltransferase